MTAIKPGDEVSVFDTLCEIPVNQGRVISMRDGKVLKLRVNEGTKYRREFKDNEVARFVLRPMSQEVA